MCIFMKVDECQIELTSHFKSGPHKSQIDFFLVRSEDRTKCKDCKVIPGEPIALQHRLVVLDVFIKGWKKRSSDKVEPRIKWWNLKGEMLNTFVERLRFERNCNLIEEPTMMWGSMAKCIKKVGKEVLGEVRRRVDVKKETWWWCEEVQRVIKEKKGFFKEWQKCKNQENWERYVKGKRVAKKIVSEAKFKAFDDYIIG